MSELLDRVGRLCSQAAALVEGSSSDAVAEIGERLDEPLRVAIAGRVKAGKSTLLNALVGERLAPTDAGECTRIVTWYRRGSGYEVEATRCDGATVPLRFSRSDGALAVDARGLELGELHHLTVRWPSSRLARMTLVDTPGLESLDEERSLRTRELFGVGTERPNEVDAVIYLLRHLHSSDRAFLDAFLDRSLSQPSPVNAVAVLSRADEIGAGRIDALDSARSIASRYLADERVRALCATVVPVAGLIAETGHTLREDEVAALRALRDVEPDELDLLLVSVDRFCTPGISPLTVESRRDLLWRLGLFGVRFCLRELGRDDDLTATALARRLVAASGLPELIEVLDLHLAPRADVLKARSALVALRSVARELATQRAGAARELEVEIERVESSSHELAELRLLHLVLTGQVELSDDERVEVERLTRPGEVTERLGLPTDTPVGEQQAHALARLEEWRTRGHHPLSSRVLTDACEIVAESYERLYVGSGQRGT
jgi:hypothetical protein